MRQRVLSYGTYEEFVKRLEELLDEGWTVVPHFAVVEKPIEAP